MKRPLTFEEMHIDSCIRLMSYNITSGLSGRVIEYLLNTVAFMVLDQYFLERNKDGD